LNTKVIYCFFVSLVFANAIWGQKYSQTGILPSINFNMKLKNDWSLNAKIESRVIFYQKRGLDVNTDYNYELSDFLLMGAKKVGLNSRLSTGYLMRFEEINFVQRFLQQVVIIQKLSGLRLAHRLLCDQTFSETATPEFRFRYRITGELPLNGTSVDPGEFYLKINNEYINSLQAGTYDLEIRAIPLLGYDILNQYKIETGLDYRISTFLNQNTQQVYWFTLSVFIEI
jgi:hypothetical protein